MAHTKKGRKVALVAGLALVVLSVAMVWKYRKEIRSWYEFHHRDFAALGKNTHGYPEYRHRQTGIVFVGLPGGTFEMGSKKDEEKELITEFTRYARRTRSLGTIRIAAEQPCQEVTVGSFLIAKYELRQSIWARLMGGNRFGLKGDDLPVRSLSWDDCREF